MARRSGGSNKTVEEKRKNLPIYQHYTLSPGKTKSHHPEAKCNHCLKEFVCGSKQRLIRHLRKCDSISNPEQIIVDTLNTLARNSATGTLNHSILEASNLLPSQIPPELQAAPRHHQYHNSRSNHQNHVAQQQQLSTPSSSTSSTSSSSMNNTLNPTATAANNNHHHNNIGVTAPITRLVSNNIHNNSDDNNSLQHLNGSTSGTPQAQKSKRGRKPGSASFNSGPGIQVTTGIDGKAHFTTVSQSSSISTSVIQHQGNSHNSQIATAPIAAAATHNHHNGRSNAAAATNNHHSSHANPISTGHRTSTPTIQASSSSINSSNNNNNNNNNINKLNIDQMDKAYLKLVLSRNLPMSLCDTKEFQTWMRTVSNDYKPPNSINLIMLNLVNETQIATQKVFNILVKAPKKTINLELHFWLDEQRSHLWYAIFANTDQKRFLVSVRDMFKNVFNLNTDTNTDGQQQHMEIDGVDQPIPQIQQTFTQVIAPELAITSFIDELVKRLGSDRMNSLIFTNCKNDFHLDRVTSKACHDLNLQHPSIVTYDCWWQFTNRLCSDITELNDNSQELLRNSKRLINFIIPKPNMSINMEKYRPFIGITGSLPRASPRWHSHLVCYLFSYIKNNRENICKILDLLCALSSQNQSTSSTSSSDNNNNNNTDNNTTDELSNSNANSTMVRDGGDTISTNNSSGLHNDQQQQQNSHLCQLQQPSFDHDLQQLQSLVKMNEYWNNLNLVLNYLKPIQEILALTSLPTIVQQQQQQQSESLNSTPRYSSIVATSLTLSEYTNWFLNYGKQLVDSWKQSPDVMKHQLIGRYLTRFNDSYDKFKLLFAAYLLNPKYRCAYMTQRAKDVAIEEILNIASEFMTEESDGLTIFDQWKLYLNREEPYDLAYDENRTTPFEWWMSLPCAESIRRVALRILRLRAFVQPKPESLFQQLYLYEDETNSQLDNSTFEDVAILRHYYDHEDKINLLSHSHPVTPASNGINSNATAYRDRSELGLVNQQNNFARGCTNNNSEEIAKLMPTDCFDSGLGSSNGHPSFSSSLSDFIESYGSGTNPNSADSNFSLQDHLGYAIFVQFVDYNEIGVTVTEEPTEKKRKKWTAQEILSKCQSNHQSINLNPISTNEMNNK